MLKPALFSHLHQHAETLRHPVDRLMHQTAVPLLVFTFFAISSWVSLGSPFGFSVTLAHLAAAAWLTYLALLDVRLALVALPLVGLCFPLAAIAPRGLVIGLGLVGGALFSTPMLRRRSARPTSPVFQALVGPVYVIAVLVGLWPIERARTLDLGGPRVG